MLLSKPNLQQSHNHPRRGVAACCKLSSGNQAKEEDSDTVRQVQGMHVSCLRMLRYIGRRHVRPNGHRPWHNLPPSLAYRLYIRPWGPKARLED
jgi:hypothetical protein